MRRLWAFLLLVVPTSPALALDPNTTDLFVRVAESAVPVDSTALSMAGTHREQMGAL